MLCVLREKLVYCLVVELLRKLTYALVTYNRLQKYLTLFFSPISHRGIGLSGEKIFKDEGVEVEFLFIFIGKLINESISDVNTIEVLSRAIEEEEDDRHIYLTLVFPCHGN